MPGSGSGVSVTPGSQGIPALRLASLVLNFSMNDSTTSSWTKRIFSAVQRCPLNDSDPVTASLTAFSRSTSGRTMPGFFASSPNIARKRWGRGCSFFKALAPLWVPIKANTSTLPLAIRALTVSRPLP
ncbi:hypothetical protein D3C78_1201570 [compost metagenome]